MRMQIVFKSYIMMDFLQVHPDYRLNCNLTEQSSSQVDLADVLELLFVTHHFHLRIHDNRTNVTGNHGTQSKAPHRELIFLHFLTTLFKYND